MNQPAQKSNSGARSILAVLVGVLVLGSINLFTDVDNPFTGLVFGALAAGVVWFATGLKR